MRQLAEIRSEIGHTIANSKHRQTITRVTRNAFVFQEDALRHAATGSPHFHSSHKANERCLGISLGILREWQKQGRRKSETTTLQPPSLSTVPVRRKHANNSKHNRRRREMLAPHTNGRAKQARRADFGDSGSLLLSSRRA